MGERARASLKKHMPMGEWSTIDAFHNNLKNEPNVHYQHEMAHDYFGSELAPKIIKHYQNHGMMKEETILEAHVSLELKSVGVNKSGESETHHVHTGNMTGIDPSDMKIHHSKVSALLKKHGFVFLTAHKTGTSKHFDYAHPEGHSASIIHAPDSDSVETKVKLKKLTQETVHADHTGE